MKLDVREWLAVGLILLVLGAEGYVLLRDPGSADEGVRATLDLAEAMGGSDTAGYALALEPRAFVFPADHAPHPGFRTEWWYVTANLEGPDGRRFGVQFTLFRSALAPEPATGETALGDDRVEDVGGVASPTEDEAAGVGSGASSWATRQVYMGHLAVTDVAGDAFHEAERFTRAAAGLAGGTAEPFRIWMDDWELEGGGGTDPDAPRAGAVFPLAVRAGEDPVRIALRLSPLKPMVLQGDRGLSQKGPEPGNASFYYSFTRLEASGEVTVAGDTVPVSGTAWLDREWSTSALSADQVGWDWFALQLDDGRDLMVYRLRRSDGSTDPLSEGVLVERDGTARRLSAGDFTLEELGRWESPLDGTVYPSGWRVRVPEEGLSLEARPVREDQELNVSVRYWEGAVDVVGSAGTSSPGGRGYVELTGYTPDAPRGRDVGSRGVGPGGP